MSVTIIGNHLCRLSNRLKFNYFQRSSKNFGTYLIGSSPFRNVLHRIEVYHFRVMSLDIHIVVLGLGVIVFNATFNNISFISWRSVFLVEETSVPRENHRPAASHWQTLSHNVVWSTPCHERVRTLVVIGTDWIGSYKSNYHTITTTMTLIYIGYRQFAKMLCVAFPLRTKF